VDLAKRSDAIVWSVTILTALTTTSGAKCQYRRRERGRRPAVDHLEQEELIKQVYSATREPL
jgi:hypothetical protein